MNDARGYGMNDYKIELARRTLVRALEDLTRSAGVPPAPDGRPARPQIPPGEAPGGRGRDGRTPEGAGGAV